MLVTVLIFCSISLTAFFCAKGEHAKSFQVQRILPPGVSEPPGALWHWRPGLLGTESFISTSCLLHQQTHCTMTALSLHPFFLQQSFYSLHPPAVNSRSHCRLWVGSIWRSLCLSSAQLSVSHVYIMVRLTALSGQSEVGGWVNTAAGPKECNKVFSIKVFSLLWALVTL